jgi:hypothetical protein
MTNVPAIKEFDMKTQVRRRAANDACFSRESWPHEVICPSLAESDPGRKLDREEFVRLVVGGIPRWAAGVLRTSWR